MIYTYTKHNAHSSIGILIDEGLTFSKMKILFSLQTITNHYLIYKYNNEWNAYHVQENFYAVKYNLESIV